MAGEPGRNIRRRVAAALAVMIFAAGASLPSPDRALLQKPFQLLDARAERYLERTTVQALSVYATCRLINATISVLQESSVQGAPGGMGVSIAVGQVLDPLNDLVERFSAVLLYSTAALAVMQVVVKIGAWSSAALLVPLGAVFLLAALSLRGPWSRRAAGWGGRFLLLALAVRLAAPAAYLLNEQVYDLFLASRYATAAAALSGSGERLAASQLEPEGEGGLWGQIRSMVDNSVEVVSNLPKLRETAEKLIGEVVILVAVFLIQTALLPLLVLWLLAKIVGGVFGRQTGGAVGGGVLWSASDRESTPLDGAPRDPERPSGRNPVCRAGPQDP